MELSNYYPADCPPVIALPVDGEFFRLVDNDPPEFDDFIPHRLKYPNIDYGNRECQACGISLILDIEEIPSIRKMVPGLKGKKLSKGVLSSGMGVGLETPSPKIESHFTWWVPIDVNPWNYFQVITLTG